jgi:hypothetical protein
MGTASRGPETGLVVRFNAARATGDRLGCNGDNGVRFFLPDDDVFQIDVTKSRPC